MLKISVDLIVGSPAERAALIAAAAVDASSTLRPSLANTMDLDDTLNTGLHAVQREHILRVLNATRWVIEGNSGARDATADDKNVECRAGHPGARLGPEQGSGGGGHRSRSL